MNREMVEGILSESSFGSGRVDYGGVMSTGQLNKTGSIICLSLQRGKFSLLNQAKFDINLLLLFCFKCEIDINLLNNSTRSCT